MAYVGEYINEFTQFGRKYFDLVLSDPDGVLKTIRLTKKFNENVTNDIKQIEMNKEILYYTENQPTTKYVPEVE